MNPYRTLAEIGDDIPSIPCSPARCRSCAWAVAIVSCALPIVACFACSPAQTKAGQAEATYTGQLAQCVDSSSTRAEADVCASVVRKLWEKRDGGTQ